MRTDFFTFRLGIGLSRLPENFTRQDSVDVLFRIAATWLLPRFAYNRDRQQWYLRLPDGWKPVPEGLVLGELFGAITGEVVYVLSMSQEEKAREIEAKWLLHVCRQSTFLHTLIDLQDYILTSHSDACTFWQELVCHCHGKEWRLIEHKTEDTWLYAPAGDVVDWWHGEIAGD